MDTDWLSLKVWQMSSFLLEKQQNIQIPLIYIRSFHATGVDQMPGTQHQSSNFKVVSKVHFITLRSSSRPIYIISGQILVFSSVFVRFCSFMRHFKDLEELVKLKA